MLDVYELCTAELQEKMQPIRSKFKEVEDKNLENQQKKVRPIYIVLSRYLSGSRKAPTLSNSAITICVVSHISVCLVFALGGGGEEAKCSKSEI